MPPDVTIRAATATDATTLWQAEVKTAEIPGQLVSRPDELSLAAFENKIRELETTGRYLVAVSQEQPVGHAFLEPMTLAAVRHVCRLTVVVHPGQTGRGIGTALVRELQHWANSQPAVHKIELLVRSTNTRARRLYERLGFGEEGIFRDRVRLSDGRFVDDVAMAWFSGTAVTKTTGSTS
ncbi:MAG TPA: GNAT family N-acetyltransferase [Polyangiaceae bacterium]|jgi:RimJ/RimL family protein N-acetyltransferase